MRYRKPVAVHFKIRGSTKEVIGERMLGPGPLLQKKLDSLCGEQEQLESSRKGENVVF